ncbi:MAG: type VII toxin-antitoxin system MntA family adenylyltransferase antitoxin [Myxococcota bacterium]
MMPGPTEDPLLTALRDSLRERSDVRVAVVFGSRGRGDARAGSDLDLGLLLEEGSSASAAAIAGELDAALGVPVQVVSLDLDTLGVPLLDRIVREGRVVHEGRRGAGASWWTRALITLETDRPWYARMSRAWLARVADEGL